jgi:hypothetical protein
MFVIFSKRVFFVIVITGKALKIIYNVLTNYGRYC